MCRGGPASTGRSTVNVAHAEEALGRLREKYHQIISENVHIGSACTDCAASLQSPFPASVWKGSREGRTDPELSNCRQQVFFVGNAFVACSWLYRGGGKKVN